MTKHETPYFPMIAECPCKQELSAALHRFGKACGNIATCCAQAIFLRALKQANLVKTAKGCRTRTARLADGNGLTMRQKDCPEFQDAAHYGSFTILSLITQVFYRRPRTTHPTANAWLLSPPVVMAVGLLAPGSDIDLLFLLPVQAERPGAKARQWSIMLYLLWDLSFKVGHAVRVPSRNAYGCCARRT